jgi:hypothetical protein
LSANQAELDEVPLQHEEDDQGITDRWLIAGGYFIR